MSTHAKLSASSAHRWIACPGSVKMSEGMPNISSPFAKEGTAAHELAQKCLTSYRPALDFLGTTIQVEGEDIDVNPDMVDNVQKYLDYCNSLEGSHHWVEARVHYSNWVKNGFGTADYIKINVLYDDKNEEASHVINVVDLKYGKGQQVSADHNEQAMMYGLGVIQTFDMYYNFNMDDIVNCVIIQPRVSDEPSEFKISVEKLLLWARDVVINKAEEAMSGSKELNPGDKQCRWCLAKGFCPALAKHSMDTASSNFVNFAEGFKLRDRGKLSNYDIGIILKNIASLRTWADGVEAYAYNLLVSGEAVPGYKLVRGRAGNKKWRDSKNVLQSLESFGISKEEVVTEKLATPTEVEKLMKAKKIKVDSEEFKSLWLQAEGKPTVARKEDKRPALESDVEASFKAIVNNS